MNNCIIVRYLDTIDEEFWTGHAWSRSALSALFASARECSKLLRCEGEQAIPRDGCKLHVVADYGTDEQRVVFETTDRTATVDIVDYLDEELTADGRPGFVRRTETWPEGPPGRCGLRTVIAPDGEAYEVLELSVSRSVRRAAGIHSCVTGCGVFVRAWSHTSRLGKFSDVGYELR
jgi:hypothetical protein